MHNECGKVLVFRVENAGKCRKIGVFGWKCNVENAVEKWKTRMRGDGSPVQGELAQERLRGCFVAM